MEVTFRFGGPVSTGDALKVYAPVVKEALDGIRVISIPDADYMLNLQGWLDRLVKQTVFTEIYLY